MIIIIINIFLQMGLHAVAFGLFISHNIDYKTLLRLIVTEYSIIENNSGDEECLLKIKL